MFERLNSHPSYFLKGSGEIIAQVSSGVRFKLAEPEATLKFNYFPFVQVEGCETSGAAIEGGAVFVHLSGCPTGAELTLKSVPPLTRLLHHE